VNLSPFWATQRDPVSWEKRKENCSLKHKVMPKSQRNILVGNVKKNVMEDCP
jgi:hypothetical protein